MKLGFHNPEDCSAIGLWVKEDITYPASYISNTEQCKLFGEFKLTPLVVVSHLFWQVNYFLIPHSALINAL